MKLTESKINWINKKVRHYCLLLKLDEPILLLAPKEYEIYKKGLRERDNIERVGRSSYRIFGVCHCYERPVVIYLHVKKHENLKQLDSTIRHELLHYKMPYLNHWSPEFYYRMIALDKGSLKNGRFVLKGTKK